MPFIDLSSPGDSTAPQKVAAMAKEDAAVKSDKAVEADTSAAVPGAPKTKAEYQEQVSEEHQLMRSIPVLEKDDDSNVKVDKSGVKEYLGPPLKTDVEKAEAKDAKNDPPADPPTAMPTGKGDDPAGGGQAAAKTDPGSKSAVSPAPVPVANVDLTGLSGLESAIGDPNSGKVQQSMAISPHPEEEAPSVLPNQAAVQQAAVAQVAPAAPPSPPMDKSLPPLPPLPVSPVTGTNTQAEAIQPSAAGASVPVAAPAAPVVPVPAAIPAAQNVPANTAPAVPAVPVPSKAMDKSLPPLPDDTALPAKEDFNLTGSALGKEKEVSQILSQANTLVEEKERNLAPALEPLSDIGVTTAGERFLTEKSTIEDFLTIAIEKNASDLHISTGYPPMLRVDGRLVSLGGKDMTLEHITALFADLLKPRLKEELEKFMDVDFSHTHKTGNRFRVNIFHKKDTLAGAFRLIPSKIKSIAELSMPPILYELIKVPQGLILLTGPTGSGKSTTIAGMIQEVNANYAKHIITVEDPIEYIFPRGKSIVDQREVGTDTIGWKRALRELLRQDPNVVLVGEMRDFETIAATITVAETGHLVFSTLHTNSAAQTIDRMIDVFPAAQQSQIRAQLANVITAVISQRLIPVNKGGRKAVVELMVATPAIRNAIRESKTYQIDNIIQTSGDLGMITLEKSLVGMIRSGDLSVEQAQSYTTKPDELISLLKNNS